MAITRSKKTEDALELPDVARNPVLPHLMQNREEHQQIRTERDRIMAQLNGSRTELDRLHSFILELKAILVIVQTESKSQCKALDIAHAQLSELRKSLDETANDLQADNEQLEREQTAHYYRERSTLIAESIKNVHRALFEGGVYGLILKACLAITGATRGLYITTRGDENTLRIRAAHDMNGYPDSSPSAFIRAVCKKVLDDNTLLLCNSEADLGSIPGPELPGEHFLNLAATQVVFLKTLNGIVIATDKLTGDFDEADVSTLLTVGEQASIAVENLYLQRELENSYVATVSKLADAVEAKDPYTHGHCDLVSRYARLTAEKLGVSDEERRIICYSALLHDVGKIGVSDSILNKPGPLTPEERDLMRAHVRIGHDLLAKIPALSNLADVVLHHHEWYNGAGYPDGLRGNQIPLAARIVGVVDAFSAMITRRSYKEAYSVASAKAELRRCAGSQFDPRVVEAFLAVLNSPEAENISSDNHAPACDLPHIFPASYMASA